MRRHIRHDLNLHGVLYQGQSVNVVYTNNPVNYRNDTNTLCGHQTCSVLKLIVHAVTTHAVLNGGVHQREHNNLLSAL